MIKRLYAESCGLYEPAFFRIDICENFDFNCWNCNTNHQKAILLHEYIHYLQDISTGYGCRNFVSIAKVLQAYIYKASIQGDIIKIPINISDIEGAELDSLLGEIYQGDSEFLENCCIDRIEIRNNEFLEEMDQVFAENSPEVLLISKGKEYRFGGMCVMESMAHLIESSIYPSEKMTNCFPYNSCEMVCRYIYPELLKNPQWIIALCDASLRSVQPGLTFYDILKRMKEDQIQLLTCEDIYKYADSFPKKWNYEEQYKETLKMIDYLYNPLATNTKNLNKWLKQKFLLAYQMRKDVNTRNFISKIVSYESRQRAEEYFLNLICFYGMPLITNKTDIYASNNVQEDIGQALLFGPLALRKIFSGISQNNECEMYKYCKAQNMTKDTCKTAPWKSASDDKLCILGQFCYSFGLENKIIEK